jgi:hypothetical protein
MSNSTFTSIAEDAIKVTTKPILFYREMEKHGDFSAAVTFIVAMAIVTSLTISILSLFGANVQSSLATGYSATVIIPMVLILKSLMGSAILFGTWRLLGSQASFSMAFRCLAYASAIAPITLALGLIPYIGIIIEIVWPVYLIYIASIEVLSRSLKWPSRYHYI